MLIVLKRNWEENNGVQQMQEQLQQGRSTNERNAKRTSKNSTAITEV